VLITTVIARNYLPQARVLARSFAAHHPQGRVVVLVLDAPGDGMRDDEPFEVIAPEALFAEADQRELRRLATIYNVMELATALKPFLLRHLLTVAGAPSATYLDPDIEVFAPLDDIAQAAEHHGIVLTPHRLTPVPADGGQPDEQVFSQSGAYNLGFVAVSAAALPFLDWWADRCRRDCIHAVPEGLFVDQRWVDVGAAYFAPHLLRDPGCNAAYWNLDERSLIRVAGGHAVGGSPLRFLHYSGYDPDEPHLLTCYHAGRPRVLLSEHPALRALCDDYGARLRDDGWDECRKLDYGRAFAANGMVLDGLMRRVFRQELLRRERTLEHDVGSVDDLPDPYDPEEVDAFVELLRTPFPGSAAPRIPRYLHALHHSRPDVQAACPDLVGLAGNHYLAWIREVGQRDLGLAPEVIPAPHEIEGAAEPPGPTSPGVRLVGYLQAELGMGELGRAMDAALRAAGEPVVTVTETVTWSRQRHRHGDPVRPSDGDVVDASEGGAVIDGAVGAVNGRGDVADVGDEGGAGDVSGLGKVGGVGDVNLVCVNADRLPVVIDRLGGAFTRGRHTIGVWAWEVEQFPGVLHGSARLVDEVWTCSAHARRAIAAAVDVPVHTVPPPVLESAPSRRSRQDLGLPDGFVFLFCFDFFSVSERKNPAGLVEAFRRAFAPGEGPQLVIKAINGRAALPDLERLRMVIGDRPDVHIVDRYYDAPDQRALIGACDAYVSLHRAEGFGYTMAEAMLAGRPVIATGYSGNLEFMDERNSFLVGHDLVAIPPGCDPYPAGSVWAEPDLDEAAQLMRRVHDDPVGAAAVAARGRQDIRRFHSPEARAPLVAARLAAARAARADAAVADALASTAPAARVRRVVVRAAGRVRSRL
jgi:glycosyltransferase involved in cell wall biosynthesis